MGTASTDHNHNMGVIDELLTAAGNFEDVSSLGEGSMLVACEDDLDVEEDALEDMVHRRRRKQCRTNHYQAAKRRAKEDNLQRDCRKWR